MRMKTYFILFVSTMTVSLILLNEGVAVAHPESTQQNPHTHTEKVQRHDHEHLNSHHSHDHHDHHGHRQDSHPQNDDKFYVKRFAKKIIAGMEYLTNRLLKTFYGFDENKGVQIVMGISLVSFINFPLYLILKAISSISPGSLKLMMCFTIGSIIGDTFLHVVPHLALHQSSTKTHDSHSHHHQFPDSYYTILAGILVFYAFERIMVIALSSKPANKVHSNSTSGKGHEHDGGSHDHDDHGHHGHVVWMHLAADFLHNGLDGLAITVAFFKSTQFGITVSLATILHELSHKIGDYAFLAKRGFSLPTILSIQLITSTGALIGGLFALSFTSEIIDHLFGFTIGSFLYLTLSHMLPEIAQIAKGEKRGLSNLIEEMICFTIGFYLMLVQVHTHAH